MENPNLDETSPARLEPENTPGSDPGETLRLPVEPEEPGAPDSGETVLTPVRADSPETLRLDLEPPAEPQPEALAETMPVTLLPQPPQEPPAGAEPEPSPAFAETMPVAVQPQPHQQPPAPPAGAPPAGAAPASRRPISLRRIALLGLVGLVIIALLSGYSGYQSGINRRKAAQVGQNTQLVSEQFQLGVQDLEAHRYDLARQRFEYVINLDPGYPGVTEKLAEVLVAINSTATPTVVPTPTQTPTPDLRGVQELFTQAQQDLSNREWSKAIDTLLALRKADVNYQAVWVDDMLYISFLNRGRDKILKDGDLEGGIYDLTLAEQFGPLDTDSKSYLTWARLYITGASFWELDWAQAVFYFGQVAPALPNLRDGSNWSATERYRLALAGYGGTLADSGEWCDAVEQYELSLSYGADPQVEEAYTRAVENCSGVSDESNDSQDNGETPPQATDVPVTTEAPPVEPTATQEAPPPEPTATQEAPPPEATPTP